MGAGISAQYGHLTLDGNVISINTAVGGAGLAVGYATIDLDGNTFSSNVASSSGGGLRLFGCDGTLDANVIVDNSAGTGGGLYLEYWSDVDLTNNVVAGNQASSRGSGLYIQRSDAGLRHTTIAGNSQGDGTGVYVTNFAAAYSTVQLENTILVSHTVGIHVDAGNAAGLEATLWNGNGTNTAGGGSITLGAVNVSGAPVFAAPAAGNYHLAPGSAAVDQGVAAGVTVDMDGQPRPSDSGYDIGADEAWWSRVYLPLTLR